MARLQVYLLGSPRVELDATPIDIRRRKSLALLAYLAITGQPHRRETLAALLWPDYDESRAAAYVRQELWALRQKVGEAWVAADAGQIGLVETPDIWVDVQIFKDVLDQSGKVGAIPLELETLEEAIALYQGDFLSGFTLSDAPGFDDWQFFQTEELRQDLARALERLVAGYISQVDYETPIQYARRWVGLDPLHEPAHRALIRLYAWTGQRAAALRQYQECVRSLYEELGVEPSPETADLYEAVKARRLSPPTPSKTPETIKKPEPEDQYEIPHNLPLQPTPFIGREQELEELAKILTDPSIRLVTVLAPGGMGKSRLALEMAQRVVNDGSQTRHTSSLPGFAKGVYFVNLAPLTAIPTLVSTIAKAIGFHFGGGSDPKQQLLDYLREKQMLLLLDNFEHLLEGVGLLSEILATAPGVQLLVTSRERLRLQEETLFRIEGLAFPDWQTPEEALGYSATRLFLQSARRVQPGFQLQPDDLQHVAAICRQVQGMPLAIILGAAWVEALSLPEIAAEIARCLDFLEADVHNIPDRHRSIRAVFNPTWNRLDETEQAVFKKLSVFRGGFTREAAQAVAGASLRQLTVLLGKSLLRRDPTSGRYDIHELLRQYAEDHLMASPDLVSEIRDLHCAYYAAFLHECEHDFAAERQLEAASDFKTDLDNIRLAWSWACRYAKAKEINRMAFSLYWGLLIVSLDMELLHMAEKAIDCIEAAETTEEREIGLAKALYLQCVPAMRLGQIEKAKASAERSWKMIETHNLEWQLEPRAVLGIVHIIQGDFAAAERLGEQLLQEYEDSDNKSSLGLGFYVLTIANLALGKFETARTYARQSYTYFHETGNRWMDAYVLNEWGNTARALGDYDEARERYQQSYEIHKDFEDSQGMGAVLNHLANIALLQGELSEAEGYYRQSVNLNRDMGNRGGIAESLEGLGNLMLRQGDTQQAEDYLIEALRTSGTEIIQFTLSILIGLGELWIRMGQHQRGGEVLAFVLHYPGSTQEIKDRIGQLKIDLGEEAEDAVWESGKPLDLETVVQELLAENDTKRQKPSGLGA